jgi:hypothetical protein
MISAGGTGPLARFNAPGTKVIKEFPLRGSREGRDEYGDDGREWPETSPNLNLNRASIVSHQVIEA